MEAEIESGDNYLDKATKWVFASEKGTTVFAIYGIGDGTVATPLYACGRNKAVSAYQKLNKILEEAENGAYRNREVFNLWLKLQKVSKGKLAAICLMLETEKQQMKMIQYIAEHEEATEDDLMRLARRIAEK